MKFLVDAKELNRVLSIVKGAISKNQSLPVLQCVRIFSENKRLYLFGTNLEVFTKFKVEDAVVEEDGEFIIDAEDLARVLSSCKGKVEFESTNKKVNIVSSVGRQKFSLLDSGDYPSTPVNKAKKLAEIVFPKTFIDLIPALVETVANDQSRPTFCGIHFRFDEKKVIAEASDGFRLAQYTFETEESYTGEALVTAKALSMVGKTFTENVKAIIRSGSISFEKDGNVIAGVLLDYKFPQVDAIIPRHSDTTITFLTEDVIKALKLAASTTESARLLAVDLEKKTVSSRSENGETEANLEFEINGFPLRVGVNADYIISALATLPAEKATISFTTAKSPMVFKSEDAPGYLHVVMPMHLGKQ